MTLDSLLKSFLHGLVPDLLVELGTNLHQVDFIWLISTFKSLLGEEVRTDDDR